MKITSMVAVIVLTFMTGMMASTDVEAKRMGGGKSFGGFNKKPSFSRQAKPFSTPSKPNAGNAAPAAGAAAAGGTAAATKRGGMMGPLMGLAAGGLLAAMFMGGAFDGIQMFDILLIGAIALGIIMFLKSRRRNSQPSPAGGPSDNWQREEPNQPEPSAYDRSTPAAPSSPAPASAAGGFAIPDIGAGLVNEELSFKPSWFVESEFMAHVESHYRQLQAHWDANEMDAIAEYVTPALHKSLVEQRLELSKDTHTDVIQLHSQLLDLTETGETVTAAILFSGLVNEDRADSATQFSEIWHVEHAKDSAEGDWFLAGIQQYDA